MENASKALLMAGGVLIALFTATLLVYLSTSSSRIANAYQQKQEKEQIRAFNKEYEAYDKTRMYGTDIITVVNKAINHNKIIGVSTTEPYYINIKIKTNQTFRTTVEKIDNTKANPTKEPVNNITSDIKNILGNPPNSYGAYLSENDTNELGDWQNNGQTFIMNNNFLDFFSGDAIDKTVRDENITYIMNSALTNFKTAIFECTNVYYNEVTGRINLMVFEQLELT